MSSVEQKIRERLDKLALAAAIWGINTKEPKPSIDEATQAILQIIESERAEFIEALMHRGYLSPESKDALRESQRANLREDK